MLEWIIKHHERILRDYGLQKPWYWNTFETALEHGHHAMHIGTWFWRPTLFWKPNAGVSREERKWLSEKYPSWEESWGVLWDQIIQNVKSGEMDEDAARDSCRRCATLRSCLSARLWTVSI